MFNFNPFNKTPKQNPAEEKPVVIQEQETASAPKPKTLDEVKQAISDLEELKNKRLTQISDLRDKKDEIRSIGVNEFVDENRQIKRTETFNNLVAEDENSLAEISQKIEDIRNEFDLTPNNVERLTEYRNRIHSYIEHIEQNMAPEYRAVEKKIINFFGEDNSVKIKDPNTILYFKDSLSQENMDLPEVQDFLNQLSDLSIHNPEHRNSIIYAISLLKEKIQTSMSEKTLYKTQGEIDEAYAKIQRGVELSDKITKRLSDAKNKEGDFSNKKGVF